MPIEWDDGEGAGSTSESLLADHRAALEQPATPFTNVGNVDTAFQGAATIVEATYWLPYCSKARFEPGAATVLVTDSRVDCCWARRRR